MNMFCLHVGFFVWKKCMLSSSVHLLLQIGPNGYYFAIDPNGYVLLHPNLQPKVWPLALCITSRGSCLEALYYFIPQLEYDLISRSRCRLEGQSLPCGINRYVDLAANWHICLRIRNKKEALWHRVEIMCFKVIAVHPRI